MRIFKGTYCGIEIAGVVTNDGNVCHFVDVNGGTWSFIGVSQVTNVTYLEEQTQASSLKKIVGDAKEINIRF